MATKTKPRVIALEEHYWDKNIASHFKGYAANRTSTLMQNLYELGEGRVKKMDENGIDVQVLSHGAPAASHIPVQVAPSLCREANDQLREAVRAHPKRFAAFACLPTPDPKAAADELERCVTKLDFKGGMIYGRTHDKFMDKKEFWPIFERAAALDVPLYLHPQEPHPAVVEAYYADYDKDFLGFKVAGWGFGVETATQCIRLVLSGLFDKYPTLKIIVGHLGENLPFALWRIHAEVKPRDPSIPFSFRDVFSEHFWVTTSGFFSTPALQCTIQEMGIERVLFSIDWPFCEIEPGVDWMRDLQLSAADKAKIYGENAAKLLKL
jgi:2,3-dihydroxybenzoate decarboxylase